MPPIKLDALQPPLPPPLNEAPSLLDVAVTEMPPMKLDNVVQPPLITPRSDGLLDSTVHSAEMPPLKLDNAVPPPLPHTHNEAPRPLTPRSDGLLDLTVRSTEGFDVDGMSLTSSFRSVTNRPVGQVDSVGASGRLHSPSLDFGDFSLLTHTNSVSIASPQKRKINMELSWTMDSLRAGQCTAVDLTGADIVDHDILSLCAVMLVSAQALTRLLLGFNKLTASGVTDLAMSVLLNLPHLQDLTLASNPIGVEGARVLADVLPRCQSLRSLNLDCCDLGDTGCNLLANALPMIGANQNLRELSLGGNNISDDGASGLVCSLPDCHTLRELTLLDNKIGNGACQQLAGILPALRCIRRVDLSNNNIGDVGAVELARAIPQCAGLLRLGLANNKINVDGGKALADMAARCPTLTHLEVTSSGIRPEDKERIRRILNANRLSPAG